MCQKNSFSPLSSESSVFIGIDYLNLALEDSNVNTGSFAKNMVVASILIYVYTSPTTTHQNMLWKPNLT